MHEQIVRNIIAPLISRTIIEKKNIPTSNGGLYSQELEIKYGLNTVIESTGLIIKHLKENHYEKEIFWGWDYSFIENNSDIAWLMANQFKRELKNKIKKFDNFYMEQLLIYKDIIKINECEYKTLLKNIEDHKEALLLINNKVKIEAEKLKEILLNNQNMIHYYFYKDNYD